MEFKKGQYVICKFHGKGNGDLLAGLIRRVDAEDVILDNLCTEGLSIKKISVLSKRNVVVLKHVAMEVAAYYRELGPVIARKLAVQRAGELKGEEIPVAIQAVVEAFHALPSKDQFYCATLLGLKPIGRKQTSTKTVI